MKYGFNDDTPISTQEAPKEPRGKTIQLGATRQQVKAPPPPAAELSAVAELGKAAGLVSRQAGTNRRKPGPKRKEAQGKLTLTGPQRVLDRLQACCDEMGGVPYWQAIEALLDKAKR